MIVNDKPSLDVHSIGNLRHGDPSKIRGFVFGKRSDIDNTSEDLWEGPTDKYVFPTVAQQMQFVSSSVEDSSTGTGVQHIHLHYLDDAYQPQVENVTLDGTTPALTVATNILRINAMHSTKVDTASAAVGNISLTNTAGTVTYGYLSAGNNTARQCVYTVPDGMMGYITHWQASAGSTGEHFTQVSMEATTHDGIYWPDVFLLIDEVGCQNNGQNISFPIPIPPKTDVKIRAISDSGSANVTALGAIMGWFEPI